MKSCLSIPNQKALLDRQLRYVGEKVPYFRSFRCNDGRPLEQFPFSFKQQVRSNYSAFISDDFRGIRSALATFLTAPRMRDERAGEPYIEEVCFSDTIIVSDTTGTSGTILRCPKTIADRVRLGIGLWRQRRSVDPLVQPLSLFPLNHYGLATPANDPWNCDVANLRSIYDVIHNGAYRWLHCPGYLLERHMTVFRNERYQPVLPNLNFIEVIGHSLNQRVAAELANFFNATIIDHYGMLETWTIAIACIHGVLHVNEHNVYVEMLDETDQPVAFGHVGRIVVTSLQQRLMPFVRYVTDDFGYFIEKSCTCRLGRTVLSLVEGRAGDILKGSLKRVVGSVFFRDVLKSIGNLENRIGCFDLSIIHIRQVTINEFVVETNDISLPSELMITLREKTESLFGTRVHFHHVILTAGEVSMQERHKPWLFRREC